ncbi:MAG: Ig-like domain-containing protein [Acidimicrobiales bacterium]
MTGDVRVATPGAVVEDLRITAGNLVITAANVTVRRVEIRGGRIDNFSGATCAGGLIIEDTSLLKHPDVRTTASTPPALQAGGYTARRVKIDGLPEGFRVGGRSVGCGPVVIEDSFARVVSPDVCGDWHGDGIQGYDGPALTLRNVTLEMVESSGCGGTAPFFYPAGQDNSTVTIDGLVVKGGGFPFRLGTPGSVVGLRIVDRSWSYGPTDVNCSLLSAWEAEIVTVDARYQPTATVRKQTCNGAPPPVGGGGGTPPPSDDRVPPTIAFSQPQSGPVRGVVTVQAEVTDAVGVAGVQFSVDGRKLRREDVSPPYRVRWDARQVRSGPHTISATARDAAGNTATATMQVVVNGIGTAPPATTTTTLPATTTTTTTQPLPTTTTAATTTTTTTATTSPTSLPAPTTTALPSGGRPVPSPSSTGVPAGWAPARSVNGDVRVTTPGAVIEDLRITEGSLVIAAPNVTVRRVEIRGGNIDNFSGATCAGGLVVEDTSVLKQAGVATTPLDPPSLQAGGYTARRVKIDGVPEGFRVGGSHTGCGPVLIEDSFARVVSPDVCGDWHGDGVQGYDGPKLTMRNVTLEMVERDDCGGTAPFFYPADQGNTSVAIDGLLVIGGGSSFRLGTSGSVTGLKIVSGSWFYGPVSVNCSLLSSWDAQIVTINASYQPTSIVRTQPCA